MAIQEKICQICGAGEDAQLSPGIMVRPALTELIKQDKGQWNEKGWICAKDLQKYRHHYIEELLSAEKGELTDLEREVIDSLKGPDLLSKNANTEYNAALTFGERLADRIADFGGSWTFLIFFAVVIVFWMALNSFILVVRPFDPYPYILLNLVLSCLAAAQAPVIMMSQNRQETRDRMRALNDYQVNLKAEIEIRQLHQKIDHMMSHQWERLIEIQEVQLDIIDELRTKKEFDGDDI